MSKPKRNPKADRLKEKDSLNLHPERVRAEHFRNSAFFDPRDLVQVKYEMLREVSHEGASKVQAAALYGMSRQAFYQALNAFTLGGIAGLLPGQRGPKGAHKLTDKVVAFIEQQQAEDPGLHAKALAETLREKLHLDVHPRSIERALARKKKTLSPEPRANAASPGDEVARHIDAYEHLRGAVLRAQARPEGLAAVTYHGLLGGLKVICAMAVPASSSLPARAAAPGAAPATDPVLVRLLANMVLFYQQEVSHVV